MAMTGLLKDGIAYLCGAFWTLAQLLDAAGISGSRSLSMSLLLKAGALHARPGVVGLNWSPPAVRHLFVPMVML